jgi:hypothetical protein
MDLIEASRKGEGGQHVHGWENITLHEEIMASAVLKTKLTTV